MNNMKVQKHSFVSGLLLSAALITSSNVVANPSGATVINGNVSFGHPNANTLNITNTPGAIINWQQFGISQGELTHFNQQSSSSTVLNRVVGQDPSKILGSLTSNGRVFLINPNGVMFGQNAIIDTAGLIASTLGMSDRDFLNGNLHFEDLTNASEILNKGFIHTSNAGEVVLVAPNIRNEGTINVENGNLVLAAGQSVTVSSLNHKNITFEVQAPSNKVVNIGKLMSDGGSIGVFAGSITNSGVISANAITVNDAGQIVLLAQADNIQQSGTVTATSNKGKGGHIEILGDRVGLFGKSVADASGKTGGGEVLVGGDFQGKTKSIKNAKQTVVAKDAQIHADATDKGDGGKAIVWADGQTAFTGSVTAKAGNQGDGGFIEISGKQHLVYKGSVDASTVNGEAGTVLFDPKNLIVANQGGAVNPPALSDNVFAFSEPTNIALSTIDADDITAITNTGTAVELQANNDITIDEDIISNNVAGNAGDLKLIAGRSVLINANIDTDNGKLLVVANADPATNPVSSVDRDAGNAAITQAVGKLINTGSNDLDLTVEAGGVINNLSGDITLRNINTTNLTVTQNVAGTNLLRLSGTATLAGNMQVTGDVSVIAGSLTVAGTSNITGNYSQSGGLATFNDTAVFSNVDLTGEVANNFVLNGMNNVIASLSMLASSTVPTFNGAGTTRVTGNFSWTGGEISHDLTLDGNLNINASAIDAKLNAGFIRLNGGIATVNDSFEINGMARFVNSGAVNVVGSNNIIGTGVFENNGVLKYEGSGIDIASISTRFIMNSGTLNVGMVDVTLKGLAGNEWNGGKITNELIGDGGAFSGGGVLTIDGDITLNTNNVKTIAFLDVIFPTTRTMTIVGDGDIDLINFGRLIHQYQSGPFATIRHQSNGNIISSTAAVGRGGTFVNEGHFVNESGDTIISARFINDATALPTSNNIEVQKGKLTIAGDFTNTSTNVLVTGGELVYRHTSASPLMDSAAYDISGGTFSVESDTNFMGSFNNSGGAVRIANGAIADFSSSAGTFTANDLILDEGATITGSDSVVINGTFSWINGLVNNQFIALNNGGIANIRAPNATLTGSFSNNGQVNILNGGVLGLTRFSEHNGGFDIAAGGELYIFNETQIFNAAITGGGTIRVAEVTPGQQGGLVLLQNSHAGKLLMEGGFITGAGSLSLADLSTWSGGSFETGGDINFNGGVDITGDVALVRTVNIFGGSMTDAQLFDFSEVPGAQTFDGPLPAGVVGKFNIAGGNFVINGNSRIGSEVTIGGGSLDIAGTLTAINGVSNTGGIIQGTGTIIGNVTNGAMLNPGNSPGTLTINGDLILLSSSILNLEIAGSDLFDQLIVSGNLEFGGELAIFVDTSSGFTGALNDEFVPFQFASSTNSFALVSAKPEGFGFEFDGLNLILTNIPGLSAVVPENDSLVFTNTLEAFIDPFVDVGNKDVDEEDEKEKTLVCS